MRAIVIGVDSAIGCALTEALQKTGIEVQGTSRRPDAGQRGHWYLDLSSGGYEGHTLPAADVVFFCAAITRFSDCAAQPALARRVNVETSVAWARGLAEIGSRVVLISTSAVYDGSEARIPHSRPTCPRTEYGRLKAAAEREFLSLGDAASVLRLTKVLDHHHPLLNGWRAALAARHTISAFSDLGLAPITMRHATEALIAIATRSASGIFQASAAADITYLDAARHLARRIGVKSELVLAQSGIEAGIPCEQLTLFSSLDSTRLSALTGTPAPDPYDVIDEVIA